MINKYKINENIIDIVQKAFKEYAKDLNLFYSLDEINKVINIILCKLFMDSINFSKINLLKISDDENFILTNLEENKFIERNNNEIKWLKSLIEEINVKDIDTPKWMFDFIILYKKYNPKKVTQKNKTINLLKSFILKNKQYNEKQILYVTENYLRTTDPKFYKESHYYISKFAGKNAESTLLSLLEETYNTNKIKSIEDDKKYLQSIVKHK